MGFHTVIEEEEEAFLHANEITQLGNFSNVLNTALEIGILQTMVEAAGGDDGSYLTPSQLAALLKLEKNPNAPSMLDHVLCYLASYSVIRCVADPGAAAGGNQRLYASAPVCKFLIKEKVVGPKFGPLVGVVSKTWHHLKDSIVEGGVPFQKAHGMSFFDYMRYNPTPGKLFNQLMCQQAEAIQQRILQTYQGFNGLNMLVDIGGGSGVTLRDIISKYPTINGINFDQPEVIKDVHPIPGVTHVAGDMFVSVPKGDAILLRRVLHNWTDKECSGILKNCYNALPEHGKVIVAEYIIPEVPDTSLVTKIACNSNTVMASLFGAKERTRNEFEVMAKGVGFEEARVACLAVDTYVIEFLKKI